MSRKLALAVAAATVLGCSDNTGLPPVPPSEVAPTVPETVEVGLVEWALAPSLVELEPGRYTFRAVNRGTRLHSFKILGQGVDAELAQPLAPGEAAELSVTLAEGFYAMYCPIPGHRELGMQGRITVAEGAILTP